ncbi:MAG: hypothetical protein H0T52_04010 [Lautropia sp.]|nr:hypothetical protein [Lautropia sp.]
MSVDGDTRRFDLGDLGDLGDLYLGALLVGWTKKAPARRGFHFSTTRLQRGL